MREIFKPCGLKTLLCDREISLPPRGRWHAKRDGGSNNSHHSDESDCILCLSIITAGISLKPSGSENMQHRRKIIFGMTFFDIIQSVFSVKKRLISLLLIFIVTVQN